MLRMARLLAACLLAAPVEGLTLQGFGDWFPWRHHSSPVQQLEQQAIPVSTTPLAEPAPVHVEVAQLNLEASSVEMDANVSGNESAEAKEEEVVVVDEAGNAMLRQWISSGPRQSQELKGLFQNDTWVKQKLNATCGKGNTSCAVVTLDKMLCEALEVAGFQGMLGSTTQLQGVLNSTINKSSVQFGVDTELRTALFQFTGDTTWPASSRDDGSAFARLMTRTLKSSPLRVLANQTCSTFEDKTLEACDNRAPRALFCQALTQAAARMKDSDEIVPVLVQSSKLRGEADEIMSSAVFGGLMDFTKSILNISKEISFDNWLRSGSDIDRTLRAKCIMGHAMRQYVESKCADPLGDCAMQVYDAMICGALQRLGDSVATPEIEKGIMWIISGQGGSFSYDVAARRAFTAKFKAQPNGTRGPELDRLQDNADYKLNAMKKKVLANSNFTSAVSRTCVPLNRIRPSCWDTAPTNLFCQALSSATSQLIGPSELFKLMQSKHAMVPN